MLLTVVHVDGSKRGQTETFQQPIISVGRDPASVLLFDPIKDQDVSTRHAQFVIQGSQLMIQDMGSRNGTFVNGQRVGTQPTPVPDAAVVQFGDKGPKVQISFRAAPEGPGKKTQMIADLQGKMQQQQKAGTKTLACTVLVLLLLGGAGAGGFVFWQKLQKREQDRSALSTAMADIPGKRKAAEDAKAPELAAADWKKAQDLEAQGEAAHKADKLAEAATLFAGAIDAYQAAKAAAERAELKGQITALAAELAKKEQERKEEQAKADLERQKELDKRKAESDQAAKEQIDKLRAELGATKTAAEMGPLVDAALASNKVAQVESVLEKVKQRVAESPNDQLAKWQDALSKRAEDLKTLAPRLEKSADAAKIKVVAIQATSYTLPKTQNERTTQIREFLTRAAGTGFYVAPDRIATAKELVEPWKFDPAALALKKKWEDLGYRVATRIDVMTLDDAGHYKVSATNNPESDNPTVTITYEGADAFADTPVDQKITFKGVDSTEKVQPHRRDASNIAVLQVKGGTATPLPLGTDDALKAGDSAIALGQKADEKPDQLRLFSQKGELTEPLILGVGGFATWAGGPVLDAGGNVVGLIVEVKPDSMRLVPPSRIKEAAGSK